MEMGANTMKKLALYLAVCTVLLLSGCQTKSKAPVLQPHELFSAAEASAITKFAVTLDSGSLYKDTDNGVISERYVYDIHSSTIHALLQIEQNGMKPESAIKAGDTALKSFTLESELSKNNSTPVNLGDKAFTINGTGQLHMIYKDYYIVVAFDADDYTTDKNAALNIQIGTKILENLKAKLK